MSLANVSKRYTLPGARSPDFKARALDWLLSRRPVTAPFWALRNVTLDVVAGETLALIGPNGCGKSTLLQLIAGILEPDEGALSVRGRVTSLLELGAGFSPDLSGRENVFLNAALHGVPESETARRVDDIVRFAELERFIGAPVRSYSSGMYVRLGFSVAVHLDPEILIVDEAFAVGDEAFQRKCLERIYEFKARGVSIVVVSHDLHLVERLADRACLLQNGRVEATGFPADVIGRYHQLSAGGAAGPERRWGTGEIRITEIELRRSASVVSSVRTRDPLEIRLHYRCAHRIERPVFGVGLHRDDGVWVSGPNSTTTGFTIEAVEGEGVVSYVVDELPLLPGRYQVSAAVYDEKLVHAYDHRDRAIPLVVVEGGTRERFGIVELGGRWRLDPVSCPKT